MLRYYLEAAKLVIRTDYNALRWIRNMADDTGELEIRILRLSEMEFTVVQNSGIVHQVVDKLELMHINN